MNNQNIQQWFAEVNRQVRQSVNRIEKQEPVPVITGNAYSLYALSEVLDSLPQPVQVKEVL